ncbi:MAG: L-seryl-tRNA(Sec) selenium transferase [Desulfobacterales bacterium]|nr:L-seryl-tRNA(Sec) selenium transferase [Desulfobacterales bacterium]
MLRRLPGVDRVLAVLEPDLAVKGIPRSVLVKAVRETLDGLRAHILGDHPPVSAESLNETAVALRAARRAQKAMQPNLRAAINATGVVVHTNLGRSRLAAAAMDQLRLIAGNYSNLEFDLATGKRGSRYSAVEALLCEITGAEAGLVVNNCAAAVLIVLDTLAREREVIVSRGELVEIGGSFRVPDIMAKSGARLREVGTTNRTHRRDYENAINAETALLLKVHQSNFSISGFTKAVSLAELVALGRSHQIPVVEDLGSGTFIDFSRYGLFPEPTVQSSVAAGTDIVTFSGDKLLGGPQAGVLVGRKRWIDRIKANPLNRALRIDKMTLTAFESTLRLYRDPSRAVAEIPTLRMLTEPLAATTARAERLAARLEVLGTGQLTIRMAAAVARAGGGALPLLEIPSHCLMVQREGFRAQSIERFMRRQLPPIIGRIENDFFILDLKTVQEDELAVIETAFRHLLEKEPQ